jgi:hypothetical protein
MNNLQNFFNKIILNYLEDVDFSDIQDEEDILSNIDVESLSKKIVSELEHYKLRFVPTPKIEDNRFAAKNTPLYCEKCGKTFGVWSSNMGHHVPQNLVESNSQEIIIIGDIV